MIPIIKKTNDSNKYAANIHIIDNTKDRTAFQFESSLEDFIEKEIKRKAGISVIQSVDSLDVFVVIEPEGDFLNALEASRRKAASVYETLKNANYRNASLKSNNEDLEKAFLEGLILSAYQFLKYKSDEEKYILKEVYSQCANEELSNLLQAIYWTRDLVNETPANQSAVDLSKEFERMASETEGLEIEVFNKVQIESLRMGGLLAINKGSVQPPTFTVMTWKPKDAINENPICVVGKGVTYDTGGINLKPTGYLETMKSDMAGSAVTAGLIKAVASNNLPIYMIALVPATDNRPGQEAIVPSDITNMMNGKTVEIINTDAEGRMILADGLCYADKFKPQLVFSIATLTGAAARAFGSKAFVSMGNAKEELKKVELAANESGERCWELPFWKDYGDELKSNIADLKHMGSINAGAITAGKFLENFVEAPYIHLDIAGVSFNEKPEDYKPIGGTGVGVRSLYNYIKGLIS